MNIDELGGFGLLQGQVRGRGDDRDTARRRLLHAQPAERPPNNTCRQRGYTWGAWRLAWVVILVSQLLASCVTPPPARKDLLAFLAVGKTTREDVLLKLGQPSASFEQDRILTYRLGQYGEKGYYIVSPKVVLPAQGASWQNVHCSLVIVFDEQGRLQKHELVRVN